MKRIIPLLFFVILVTRAGAQTLAQNTTNQGDQEIFWAIKLFKEQYKAEVYKKYNGKVKLIDNRNLQFGNKSVEYYGADSLRGVFTNGLLYPQLLWPGEIRVLSITEAYYLDHSLQIRRFRVDVVHKGFNNSQGWVTNPTIYFFELTNSRANNKTTIADFIKGAKLTFLKGGWVQI